MGRGSGVLELVLTGSQEPIVKIFRNCLTWLILRQLKIVHGGSILYPGKSANTTNPVFPTLESQLLNIYQCTTGHCLLCKGASSLFPEGCKKRQSTAWGEMRPRGSSLVRRLRLDDIKRPYFLAPEPMESQVLRKKKKLNQGNYSCQEIINHLTQRLGVGHEEPQACRFHGRKALSNVTRGVSGNTGSRTHVCNLPARAPCRAHGLGQWARETGTASCTIWGLSPPPKYKLCDSTDHTSFATVGFPVPSFVPGT